MGTVYERKIPLLDCGHEYMREVIYGRWKIPLIYHIANGVSRPGELERKIPQATRRVLDAQLLQLLNHGIVSKIVYHEAVQRVEYQLTELGSSLYPVVMTMANWANENKDQLKDLVLKK